MDSNYALENRILTLLSCFHKFIYEMKAFVRSDLTHDMLNRLYGRQQSILRAAFAKSNFSDTVS